MNNRNRSFIAFIIVAALFAGGAYYQKVFSRKPPVIPRTVTVSRGDILIKVSETGTFEPVDKIDIKSKVAGRLLSIPIVEGEYIAKGQ